MELIPIRENKIKPFIGQTVCAVLHDGSYCTGTLKKVNGNHLILETNTITTNSPQLHALLSTNRNKANISFFFPGLGFGLSLGFLGGGIGLGLGALSFLFAGRLARFFI